MAIRIGQSADHGFDQPLGLLQDCHRRIERFLGVMLEVAKAARNRTLADDERRALEASRHYFATAAPRHTADEEASLFPRLRAAAGERGAALFETMTALDADHRRAEGLHDAVDSLLGRWMAAGALSPDESASLVGALEALSDLYARHIGIEDRTLFPAAGELLSPDAIETIGREMADRRGVPYRPPLDLARRG